MAKQLPKVEVMEWPKRFPASWRYRGQLHYYVMCFHDGDEAVVVYRWYSRKRGWRYECERMSQLEWVMFNESSKGTIRT